MCAPIREKYNLFVAQNNSAAIPDKMHSMRYLFLVVGCSCLEACRSCSRVHGLSSLTCYNSLVVEGNCLEACFGYLGVHGM